MRSSKTPEVELTALNYGTLPSLIGYQLRLAQIRVFRDFMQATAAHDISPGLLGVLMLIGSNPGLTQSALAAAVHLDRSTMVGVIDRLEARGWVERQAAKTDRRAYQLLLTPAGAVQLEEFAGLVAAHEKRILHALTPGETGELRRLLQKVAGGA